MSKLFVVLVFQRYVYIDDSEYEYSQPEKWAFPWDSEHRDTVARSTSTSSQTENIYGYIRLQAMQEE